LSELLPAGSSGEEAKLRPRGARRQPGL